MGNITEYLKNIRSAIFGKDVRESIAKAIEQTYEDATESGNANMEVIDARGSYGTLKKRLDGDKTNLQSQINGLASGSPLVASSVAGMTDTSKVYVCTADGHWYWCNGTTWVDGGVYQATEDSKTVNVLVENFINLGKNKYINSRLKKDGYVNQDGSINSDNGYGYYLIELNNEQTYYFHKNDSNPWFGFLGDYDEETHKYNVIYMSQNTTSTGIIPETAKYFYLQYMRQNEEIEFTLLFDNKNIFEKIFDVLDSKINKINNSLGSINIFENLLTVYGYFVLPGNSIMYNNSNVFKIVPINPGDNITIIPTESTNSRYAVLSDYDLQNSNFTAIEYDRILTGVHIKAPINSKYLYFMTKYLDSDVNYEKIEINGISVLDNLTNNLINLKYSKKRISILGDSYSTFGGFVTPETNRCYYNGEVPNTDVTEVEDTWWYQLIKDENGILEYNNSYSGSPVCNTGYSGADASNFSFLKRMSNIGRPDIIFIYGGTNDSWANVPIGNFKYNNWDENDLKTFRPAFAYMINYLLKHNPNSIIYNISNYQLKKDITNSMSTICEYYNIKNIILPELDQQGNHPTKAIMKEIADYVKLKINKD